MYTLREVWQPIKSTTATLIQTTYVATTPSSNLDPSIATKINELAYNYCHSLMDCNMLFDDEATLAELQQILKDVIVHKAYMLVTEWKALEAIIDLDKGKIHTQESYYAVADAPRIDNVQYNELEIKTKQLEAMYTHTQAIRDLYNEIKQLVQTIYY